MKSLPLNQVIYGNCIEVITDWRNNCIDSIITDPPYGLKFMGKGWDKILPNPETWTECLRIAKPGAIMLCFGGTRTFHRLTCAIEDAGWEIRDCMMWLYGSGFPKSHNISKALHKSGKENWQLWNGYGTALKPAWEPIIVAMKPKEGSFADNAEKYGVAGLNIDGGRIGTEQIKTCAKKKGESFTSVGNAQGFEGCSESIHQGRWPANLILDEEVGKMLDEQSGKLQRGHFPAKQNKHKASSFSIAKGKIASEKYMNDSGGASRFFYCAKTSKRERNLGLDNQSGKKVNDGRETPIDNPYQRGETIRQNTHPTVKPLALMKYLCVLLKMPNPNQIILDPFAGSGSTCIACKELGINYIGIENESEYCEISHQRLDVDKGIQLKEKILF